MIKHDGKPWITKQLPRGHSKKAITRYHQFKIEQLDDFELNDTGNAHRFVSNFEGQVRYNVDNKHWMIYNGKYWQYDAYGTVKNYAEIVIEEMKQEAMSSNGDRQKKLLTNIKRAMSSNGKEAMLRRISTFGTTCNELTSPTRNLIC